MNLSNPFPRSHFLFAPDEGGGAPPAEPAADIPPTEQPPTAEEKKFTQADIDKIVKDRLERENKKAEQAAAKAKADAEAAALAEQGKFKELADKAQKDAEQEKAAREQREAELRSLRMKSSFEKSAAKLGLTFANDAAVEDAFEKLDAEAVGDDFKGMDEALKKLLKDRPYLFKEVPPADDIDAQDKGRQKTALTDARIAELKQKYRIN